MPETGYINYGTTQSNVPAQLKVYYNVVTRTPSSVTIEIDVGVNYTSQWSTNGCWVQVGGENRSCNPNRIADKYYWYASSQGNSRSSYWKKVTLSAAVAATSVSLSVGFSNKAYAAGTFQFNSFTLNIPMGNTNARWSTPICTVSPSGTFPENNGTLSVGWSGAIDDEGDQIQYRTEIWKNGSFAQGYIGGSGTTDTKGYLNVSGDAQGTSYYFRTHCKDKASSDWVFGRQSPTVTKNKFTMASSFAIASPSVITPRSTYTLGCTHNAPSNTNGNNSFTYGLSAFFVNQSGSAYSLTISGVTSTLVSASSFNVTIWDGTGGTPTGIYIKQSDIKAACDSYASTTYTGTLQLTMTCSNAYGSSGSIQASRAINWQYTPEAPTAPTFSSNSYYSLPDKEEPVFIINRRPITWTWEAVTDPNDTPVSYQVYSKTAAGSWILVATTSSTSYTTPTTGLSQAQTYQIQVRARFSYGTLSPDNSAVGPQITLHYYNLPVVMASIAERNQKSVTVKTVVNASTSLSNSIGAVTLSYSGLVNETKSTTAPLFKNSYEESKTFTDLEETSSGNIILTYSDSIMSAILESQTVSASVVVTQWSALLTIREKGIGINAVAGDFADIILKGTTAMHGGDAHDKADGSLNFSVASDAKSPYINWYQGAYFDSDGNLRAAQDMTSPSYFTHLQFNNTGSSSTESGLRRRYWCYNQDVTKDVLLTANNIIYGSWQNIPIDRIGTSGTAGFLKISNTYTSNLGVSDTAASQSALYNAYNGLQNELKQTILDIGNPVGTVRTSTNNVNPSTYMGGTWVPFGAGRTIVGLDSTQTEFSTANKTGGSKTHILTEEQMPSHSHITNFLSVMVPQGGYYGVFAPGGNNATRATTDTGEGQPHNNLPPYIVVYMWLRTA